jgi:hypothetical protein
VRTLLGKCERARAGQWLQLHVPDTLLRASDFWMESIVLTRVTAAKWQAVRRCSRTRSLRAVIVGVHPIRSAITATGLHATGGNNSRSTRSTASTTPLSPPGPTRDAVVGVGPSFMLRLRPWFWTEEDMCLT